MKSVMQSGKKCYYCNSTYNLEKHHCLFGTANRKKAEQDGLWVWLCHDCHQGVHNQNTYAKESLQKKAQFQYEIMHSREEFIERYGKSYL